ncbi:hypothetical protein D3C87_1846810 [compost metagenome]
MPEALAPFIELEAAVALARHDAAPAQRIAADVQRQVDGVCKVADCLARLVGHIVVQDDRVVLVGCNGLLGAPLRA